ncbi:MAG TPA: hypothetical protein DIT88_07990 [Planctomycetaceae bacterium]|nr:hypothetical protein [Planctomycetaceae bacterium]
MVFAAKAGNTNTPEPSIEERLMAMTAHNPSVRVGLCFVLEIMTTQKYIQSVIGIKLVTNA